MEAPASEYWRKCSSCKKPIAFNTNYYICSVSTCNGQRTGYVFCTIPCWDAHVPGARHRDAGALERKSPGRNSNPTPPSEGARKIVVASQASSTPSSAAVSSKVSIPRDVLIVASKLKDYIRARSDMNTSASVMDVLSEHVRRLCDEAIDNARKEGRKTVLDRDFPAP